ncbi:hypothetical protein K474DRAFT_1775744 [Panus rudis PR-1116 ss-1]|nr:hypothetical protein K474DRAFT_1775744 [Panus rudis PR-1116 ss-1]
MHLSLFLIFLWTTLFVTLEVCAETVYVNHPLENQLPRVARVNQTYSWTFSSGTFCLSSQPSGSGSSSPGNKEKDFNPASNATSGGLTYTTSSLPAWLSFDSSKRTFTGTPAPSDLGSPSISVTAHSSSDSATSVFTLLVSSSPPPVLKHAIEEQFKLPNPSLSSVFLLSDNSALKADRPALRIPPGWSFSIGFQYNTFEGPNNIFYAALQADGSPLPTWMSFNEREITFNGYTPKKTNGTGDMVYPHTVTLALHGSDREGYSAASLPFDVVIAEHELALAPSSLSLPTINVTAETYFSVSLNSPADFYGVLLDGKQLEPTEVTVLEVDTSYYGEWLEYDTKSRTLSGTPPDMLKEGDTSTRLPVTLTTTVNQTIETNVSLAIVQSYFTQSALQPILITPGQQVNFNLAQFYSNASTAGGKDDVNLTAAFDPENAGNFLTFDSGSALLSGTVPSSVNYTHISVTFTAYSRVTHSTSHTALPVSLTSSDFAHQHGHPAGLSTAAKAKLLLGLKVAFAVVGGMLLLGGLLALFRKCARVQDSAVLGEEGMRAWTEEERKWYGIGIDVNGEPVGGRSPSSSPTKEGEAPSYRWTDAALRGQSPLTAASDKYGQLGLHRPFNLRTESNLSSGPQSPGMMRKGEFMGKIKYTARKVSNDTARIVSDTYRRVLDGTLRGQRRGRPLISKPVLILPADQAHASTDGRTYTRSPSASPRVGDDPDFNLTQYSGATGTTSVVGSPSSSTGCTSIPARRPDFARPRSPLVPPQPARTRTGGSNGTHDRRKSHTSSFDSSTSSLDTTSSSRSHAVEAIVQTASRAMSIRSGFSGTSAAAPATIERPRLVPFKNSNRVPVPKLPAELDQSQHPSRIETSSPNSHSHSSHHNSNSPTTSLDEDASVLGNEKGRTKRVVSQVAKVFRSASMEKNTRRDAAERAQSQRRSGDDVGQEQEDDLMESVQYIRFPGDDLGLSADASPDSFSISQSPTPSGSAAEGAVGGRASTPEAPRVITSARTRFQYTIPLHLPSSADPFADDSSPDSGSPNLDLLSSDLPIKVRLTNGSRLPPFMAFADSSSSPRATDKNAKGKGKERRVIISGTPLSSNVGEYSVGVYLCVGAAKGGKGKGKAKEEEEVREVCVGRMDVQVVPPRY